MNLLEDFELQIMAFDERLRPIAQRPVDITRPGWFERLQAGVPPLEEAGIRKEVEKLLADLIEIYAQGPEEIRITIRRFFSEYRSFAWAAGLSESKTSATGLRPHLILFSMKDQGRDSRDALLALQHLYSEAAGAGIDPALLLREVAGLSSTVNKYGMGSTCDMLLKYCQGV